MYLIPAELSWKIIGYLPITDQLTLRAVSKYWKNFFGHEHFKTIYINSEEVVKYWLFLDSNTFREEIMEKVVTSLCCRIDNPEYFETFFTYKLDEFKILTSLRLARVNLDGNSSLIVKVQQHIKTLTLAHCCFTVNGFAKLVNHFPELTHLKLINISRNTKKEQDPLPSNLPLKSGRMLSIADLSRNNVPILTWILLTQWDDVSVLEGQNIGRLETQYLIDRVSGNVKRLDLQENLCRTYRDRPIILPWER